MKHFTLPKDGGLIETGLPLGILHSYEKISAEIRTDMDTASEEIAGIIIKAINDFGRTEPGRAFKLGLSTGMSPVVLYQILSRRNKEGDVSFKNVEIFSIDEYYPVGTNGAKGRNRKLYTELLDNIDIPAANIHIPDASVPQTDIGAYCAEFDKAARNLDLLVIGVGQQGQVGFNEAGASELSRTRTVQLSYKTRKIQARNFNGALEDTPRMAVTMGISTMMSAKKVILMAFGESKVNTVKAIVEGEMGPAYPASWFQKHEDVTMYVDETASSLLTRVDAPWLIGPCEWTRKFRRKAVVWLCQKVGKPILKLSQKDYLENSLGELIELYGPYDKINIDIFNDLQHTITGWPGGKPEDTSTTRPVASTPFPKKVLIFSPHPDDDVISMGGTFIRLAHQGHEVHVAYETSGDVAVHNDVVIQHMDAAYQLGFGDRRQEVKDLVASFVPGEAEPKELLAIKAAIRRSEARGAVRSFGLDDDNNAHFLNLPFYESGGVKKLPRTQVDVDIIKDLMQKIQPDQIYMAGDLADPHGTHRVCTEAALEALDQLREEGAAWVKNCNVWLYRGAWMEWELGRVDMAVPLSPDEVVEKRYAIYHHLSQKDIVPFPGDDPREFWQRAEDRTSGTAKLYDKLGMAEYQAMEVFLKLY
ncbi:MAG: PIG-L family deacetylase [Bacteroidales bacterium]|nr:PIG-L family deacetylase [Bacteroidales bacterium]